MINTRAQTWLKSLLVDKNKSASVSKSLRMMAMKIEIMMIKK